MRKKFKKDGYIRRLHTFHLIRYTNPRGLTTIYTYDKAGRLIREESRGREKSYTYDLLGFLERTTDGIATQVEIHDVMGRTVAHWTEDNTGRIENHTTYTYIKNRKDTAKRQTSQGEAFDQFFYDKEGRLERHVDPLNNVSQFIYAVAENDLGQRVWTKKLIDAKNNVTLETFDVTSRVVEIEHFDENEQTVSREEIFYDRAGNKAKVVHTIYQGTSPCKTTTTAWIFNNMGKRIQQIEGEQKITTYNYFPMEAKEEKILPSGTELTSYFDGLGRPIELKSSDGSIHIIYNYSKDQSEVKVCDLVHNRVVERHYNFFGELIQENGNTIWTYDNQGRCEEFTLGALGAIRYIYDGMHLVEVERLTRERKHLYAHRYTQFDANGHVHKEELIGGLGHIQTIHDLLERPKSQESAWLKQSIGYGPSGLVIEAENSLFASKTYDHDPLNQITSEGEILYAFDSLGNPISCETNDCNELLSGPDYTLQYDRNGNPYKRVTNAGTTEYMYDALGRLTEISTPDKIVSYEYDPLSRLYSKQITTPAQSSTFFYLYDKDKEIGLIDQNGAVLEFKVLGLGVKGEIGAAIAIELGNEVFTPLHDFRGNVIAILSSDGTIAESSDFDAFGLEDKPTDSYRNPWRFSSKRTEETGLIFFGLRFYDPVLQRFLTPDPSGFADGPNLYAYTRNNPLNRLDLFGLDSENFLVPLRIEVPKENFSAIPNFDLPIVVCKYIVPNGKVDGFIFCSAFHQLEFSPIEIEEGMVDICSHLHELVAANGKGIFATVLGNGIATPKKELLKMFQSTVSKIEEGTLSFAIHNSSKGFFKDTWRLIGELYWRKETPIIRNMQQIIAGLSERIASINNQAKLLDIMHSENGLIMHRALETMPGEWKAQIDTNVIFAGYGLVLPLPEGFGMRAINIYSEKDGLTLGFKKHWDPNATYDIQLVPCISKWHEKSAFIYDHAFLAPTGQQAMTDLIKKLGGEYGFYRPDTR